MINTTIKEKSRKSIADFLANMDWFDSFVDGLAIADDAEIIKYCNPACAKIFDYDNIDQIIGKNILDFLDDYAKEIVNTQTSLRKNNESTKYDLSIKTSRGNLKTISVSVAPVFDETHNYSGTLAHMIDTTERKKAEAALKESEQKFSSVIENIGIGISLISPKMEILSLNKKMREWFPQIEIAQRPICYKAFNLPPRNNICEYCPTHLTLKDGLTHESISETPTGSEIRYFRIISSPIRNNNNKVIAAIEMVEDITRQKREETLRKNRGDFLRKLVGRNDAREVAALASEYISSLMPCDSGMLILYNEQDKLHPWQMVYSFDIDNAGNKIIDNERRLLNPALDSQLKLAAVEKKPMILHRNESQYKEALAKSGNMFGNENRSSRSLAYFPLIIKDLVVGAMTVQSYQENFFNQERIMILDLVSADLALALNAIMHQEALRDSEEKLNVMANTALDAIIVIDNEDKITFWNDAAQSTFGYSRDEILGKELHRMLAPVRFRESYQANIGNFHKTGKGGAIGNIVQLAAIHKDGHEFPIEISLSAMKVKDQWHAVGIVRDITEQFKARENQARIVAQYTAMINAVPAQIFIKDKDLKYLEVNESLCALVGKTRDEIIGKNVLDIYPKDIAELYQSLDLSVLNEGKPIINLEKNLAYGQDEMSWISITIMPLEDADSKVIGLVGMTQDITEFHKSRDQLIQSDKLAAIGTLAAGVAHEINNPIGYINSNLNTMNKYLTKINQYTDIVKNADTNKWNELKEMLGDFVDAVNESIEGANRVRKIVADLKSFSRVDRAEKEMANLNEGIESTLNIVWNEIKYNCKVEKDFGEIPEIYCMPNQLNQVFLNLMVNAGQAISGKDGLIKIKTRADEENIYVSVEDNGCGIPDNNLKRIFEPFFTTKEVGKGTGLGLSLVYDIIKKHGGDIQVDSKVGVGTKFTIVLSRAGLIDEI